MTFFSADLDYTSIPPTQLLFSNSLTRDTFNINILPDELNEGNEVFGVALEMKAFLDANRSVSLTSQEQSRIIATSYADVLIIDMEINDTTIGDPFFTVPILVSDEDLKAIERPNLALCFEVHGRANKWYNLVTDKCVSVMVGLSISAQV